MKLNTQNSEKALLKVLIKEKVCVGNPINVTDSTQYAFLLGHREKIYTLINPKILLRNLKAFFYFLRNMVQSNETLCFILNTESLILFEKLNYACKASDNLVFNQNIKFNTLVAKKKPRAIIALFLDTARLNVLYTEAKALNIPIICFTNQITNFFSADFQILASFKTKAAKNLLVSLIILSLKK
jgi:ribosomal protein S2